MTAIDYSVTANNIEGSSCLPHGRRAFSLMTYLLPAIASAQTKDASAILNTATTSLKAIGTPLVNIVSVIIGLIGIVMLVPCFARYLRNEPGAGEAFVKHAGGYLIAIILLQVFRLVALS